MWPRGGVCGFIILFFGAGFMYYSDNIIEDIRMGNDIVDVIGSYVQLKQKGNSYFGLCPFHKEHTPSFSVSPDEQLYHCFGCNASGNVYSFIMQMENYDFIDSIKFLADRINYALPEEGAFGTVNKNNQIKADIYEIHKKAARFYYSILNSDEGKRAVDYLDSRKVSLSVRKKYGLGFSSFNRNSLSDFLIKEGYDVETLVKSGLVFPDKKGGCYDKFFSRLMFPIIDVQGRIIAFGGRIIGEGEPKYLNSPDTPVFKKSQNLYSINFARKSGTKEFILVEGYMDVISLYQAGFKNVVAALGTAFNNDHARALKKYANSAVLLFDSDDAGTKAALRAGPVLWENGIKVKVLQVKDAKDPDEYVKKFGKSAFEDLLTKEAKSFISFEIECERAKYNLDNTDEKVIFTNKVAEILARLDNAIERDAYIGEAVRITGISRDAIVNQINKVSQNGMLSFSPVKYNKPKRKVNGHGVDNGKQNIIRIMASNYDVYKKIRGFLSPEEFITPVYVKLVKIIDDFYEKGQNIYSAEIVNYFDSLEEQQLVSNIFVSQVDFDDVKAMEKAINDEVRAIKLYYINNVSMISAQEAQDAEALQKFIIEKKSIGALNITLSDG